MSTRAAFLQVFFLSTITSLTVAQDGCIDDLNKIWYAEGMELQKDLEALQADGRLDESIVMIQPEDVETPRTYILCPNTEYITGSFFYDESIDQTEYLGGSAPLGGRSNMHVKCGEDGSSSNNCTIHTGEFGFSLRYFEFLDAEYAGEGIFRNVTIEGVTFGMAPAAQFSFLDTPVVVEDYTGDLTFLDCIFQDQRHAGEIILIPNVDSNFACENGDRILETTFDQCTFRNFQSVSEGAGNPLAFSIMYSLCPNQQTNVINCRFENNNYARDESGAPFSGLVSGDGGFRIEGNCFTNNQYIGGGPVIIYQTTNTSPVVVENNYEFNNSITVRKGDESDACTMATYFDPAQFGANGVLVSGAVATCFDVDRTIGCIMDTEAPSTGPTAKPTVPQPTAAPTTPAPSLSFEPTLEPFDMKECLVGLSLTDSDFNNFLDQSEYVAFCNRQGGNAWLNQSFADLPEALQTNFVNKTTGEGEGGQGLVVDIVGSKPWQAPAEPGSDQAIRLEKFCVDTMDEIDIALLPPTMAPTTKPECISNTSDIYLAERKFRPEETSLQHRLYILCPNTIFETGLLDVRTPEPIVTLVGGNGMHPLLPRANVTIQCGDDGKRSNNCTITGLEGLLGVSDLYGQIGNAAVDPTLVDFDITGFHLKGVTFDRMQIGAFQIRELLGRDILIEDVAFVNNELPLFMSLTGVPEFAPPTEGTAEARSSNGNIFGYTHGGRGLQGGLSIPWGAPLEITFRDCLFANNRNLKQSGALEDQFSTHEFNQMIWGGTITTVARFESTLFIGNNYSDPIDLALPDDQVITDMSHLMFGAFVLELEDCCFIDNLVHESASLIQTVVPGVLGTFNNNFVSTPIYNSTGCSFVGQVTANQTHECVEADRTDGCDLLPTTSMPTPLPTKEPTATPPPTSAPSAAGPGPGPGPKDGGPSNATMGRQLSVSLLLFLLSTVSLLWGGIMR